MQRLFSWEIGRCFDFKFLLASQSSPKNNHNNKIPRTTARISRNWSGRLHLRAFSVGVVLDICFVSRVAHKAQWCHRHLMYWLTLLLGQLRLQCPQFSGSLFPQLQQRLLEHTTFSEGPPAFHYTADFCFWDLPLSQSAASSWRLPPSSSGCRWRGSLSGSEWWAHSKHMFCQLRNVVNNVIFITINLRVPFQRLFLAFAACFCGL